MDTVVLLAADACEKFVNDQHSLGRSYDSPSRSLITLLLNDGF